MTRRLLWFTLLYLSTILSGTALSASPAPLWAYNLKTEYQKDPIAVEASAPRFSWMLRSHVRAQKQTAYQVLVATSKQTLKADFGDKWDSGKVMGSQSLHVVYAGKLLTSGALCYWKVRVWDRGGKPSEWSLPAPFEMGILHPEDWKAKWIGDGKPLPSREEDFYKDDPMPLLRHEFRVEKPLARARLSIVGLGYYEAFINGQRVGDRYLDTGWTDYRKRVLYSTYDVTAQLQAGDNCIGTVLGNGWFNPLPMRFWGSINLRNALLMGRPCLLAQITLTYRDGTQDIIGTDENWQTAESPVIRNSIYLGERYDAQREIPNWTIVGGVEGWQKAHLTSPKTGALHAQTQPPITIVRTIRPLKIVEHDPGTSIVDFGQNFAGRVRLWCKGKAGTEIKLRYGELLNPDGTLNPMTAVAGQIKSHSPDSPYGKGAPIPAEQSDTYILRGGGEESYSPHFTFHGFRYVEITGYPRRLTRGDIEGQVMSSNVESVSDFACSNPMFGQIDIVTQRTFQSNLFSVQSDCPHREKFGYGGDIVPTSEAFMLHYDMTTFYQKAVRDFADAVRPNGGLTETAPYVGIGDNGFGGGTGPIGWQIAHPFLLTQLYRYYGDKSLLEEQYDVAKRALETIRSKTPNFITQSCIGDHETLAPHSDGVVATAFYYRFAQLVAQIAKWIDRTNDAEEYTKLAEEIRNAFIQRFVKEGVVDIGTQACQAFALSYNLLPADQKDLAMKHLLTNIREENTGHLTTGIFGTRLMMDVLSQSGHGGVAYTIANQRTFPSWGFMLSEGETTLRETWKNSDNVYSHNHPMFGSISAWFYERVVGIRPDDSAIGCDKVTIRPGLFGDLKYADGRYESIRGLVAVSWRVRHDGKYDIAIQIPVGMTATLQLPTSDSTWITESKTAPRKQAGVTSLGVQEGVALFHLEAGKYQFRAPLPR
ncbi:MAG: family 78 glycoside hydrolase catalytic domain [Armatimonadetes bacterium]|nr:family 78 glycoside hydrolase catalytic domain [Armatimonadota bacterium]